jgi:hypothetical protein
LTIKENAYKLSWYMRGGLDMVDAMNLGHEDREIIRKLIEDNLKTTKDSGLPFF